MTATSSAPLATIVAAVEEPSPRGIASAVSRLVRHGTLPSGTRLPTVRAVASALGVSPATVSGAWHALAGAGVLVSRGRAGSYVLTPDTTWMPPRYRDLAAAHSGAGLDLSTGTPDPLLLPDLRPALARVAERALTSSYVDAPVIPALEQQLRTTWPYPVEAITVVDGAMDAMARCLELLVRYGERVVVEQATFPPLLDLLDHLGAVRVPVATDSDGIVPSELAAALRTAPVAVLLRPRAHNPTGASMSAGRARELARVLRAAPDARATVVIEDDHSGDVAAAPDISLGSHSPDRVLHIRSFSKSHGPDLRIAAIGGSSRLVDAVAARRMLGPGWTSRMLQHVLLDLLTSDEGGAAVAAARRVYQDRQHRLAAALGENGVRVTPGDGINLWLPVASEQAALVRLAAAGILVAPGSPFQVSPGDAAAVRVTAGMVRGDFAAIGTVLADAATATP